MPLNMGKVQILIFLLFVIPLVNARSTSDPSRAKENLAASANEGLPWPLPQEYTTTPNLMRIDAAEFEFRSADAYSDIMMDAFQRYRSIIFGKNGRSKSSNSESKSLKFKSEGVLNYTMTAMDIEFPYECTSDFPALDMDESYAIYILPDSNDSLMLATTCWGVLRGLETFSQLVFQNEEGEYFIRVTTILDSPRFSHRGILLDTSRHFLKKEIILENLDAMAQNKFNVLHWHMTDDESFPYQSIEIPDLSEKGAYDPRTHIYTNSDVEEIVRYARFRGIRVIVEFNSPGHTLSWAKSGREMLTPCYDSQGHPTGKLGPFDPTVPHTTLQYVLEEASDLFPDYYIFLGGDKVSYDCWQSNPKIRDFMKKMGFGTDYSKLQRYYEETLLKMLTRLKNGYIFWQDVIDMNVQVANDSIFDVWKGDDYKEELAKITSLGYKTILSSCWYLDNISYGSDWQKFYTCDPQDFQGSQSQKDLVIGGEANMWGEFVDDTNLISRMWPRAAAIAERLWSPANVTNIEDATARLASHRCRMVKRGFAAEPLMGPGFCKVEF